MGFEDVNVAEICVGSGIGDDSRQTDLVVLVE
jgi:hypothetical protein